MENKVTTRESLKKLAEALQKEDFKKEFNKLFINYINVKNADKNAHYHAILKLLTDAGLDKHEAEHVFKQLRVQNADLIQNVQEIQKKREELDKNWNEKKWKLLANPLDVKTFAQIVLETLHDINLAFKQMQQQIKLNKENEKIFGEKIEEIKKLIYNTEEDLKQLIEHDPENTFGLHDAVKSIQKIADKATELTTEVVNKSIENEFKKEEKEKELTEQLKKAEEKTNKRYWNYTLKKFDKKTYDYLVLYHFFHTDNNFEKFDFKDVYKKFKDTFNVDEFVNIVLFNKKDIELNGFYFDIGIDEHVRWEGFNKSNIQKYVKDLRKEKEYEELAEKLKKELIKMEKERGQEGKEKVVENPQPETQAPAERETESAKSNDDILIDDTTQTESVQNDLTLEQALENSLHATLNSLNSEIDEKTLSFLTLSEYLHAYNNFDLKNVYEKFKDTFDKDEFKAIVIYNTALQDNATDDVFDFAVEEGYEAVNIKEYAKMLKHNFDEYKELDAELERELTPREKEKELEIGAPQRNKKFKTLEI